MTPEQLLLVQNLITLLKSKDLPEADELYNLLLQHYNDPISARLEVEILWASLEDVLDLFDIEKARQK